MPDQDAITASDAYLAAAKAAIEAVALYDPFSQGQASIVAAVNACTLLVPEDGRVADPLFVTPSPSEPEKDPFP